ncbi:MAG: SRPBCC domain-containing protein [Clostridia bacterium]|nr:SRPBCC domain-containing protein [Clostridia bacterium]
MAKFLHEGTRLYTHTTRAYKLFTNEKEIAKWHEGPFVIDFSEGGIFDIAISTGDQTIRSAGTCYRSYERESLILLDWKDDYCFSNRVSSVEIRIMSATSETEYCTEIHVLHQGLDDLDEAQLTAYKAFWKGILGKMHQLINRGWFISDAELTLDCFK